MPSSRATGKLKGPLHGIPFAIKDQFDTSDMRTTSGAAARYANDRPPRDATVVARLRAAGAIILAKANIGEYASGDRSTYGGTTCNPYDTSRSAGRSSGGSGAAVAANLVDVRARRGDRAVGAQSRLERQPGRHRRDQQPCQPRRASSRPRSRATGPACCAARSRMPRPCSRVLAGYDPRDPATAESLEHAGMALRDLCRQRDAHKACASAWCANSCSRTPRRTKKRSASPISAIADLAKAGATIVDPGPEGELFKDAIAEIVPALDTPTLAAVYKELFPTSTPFVDRTVEISGNAAQLPPELTIRLLAEREPPTSPAKCSTRSTATCATAATPTSRPCAISSRNRRSSITRRSTA